MEYLSRLLKELEDNKQYKYHPKYAKIKLTHLSFANDLLLFAKGDKLSIQLLYDKFLVFSQASGLKANMAKSSVYFGGVARNEQENIIQLGRVQLVKTVIFGLPSYWAQLFLLPAKVLKTIEDYCTSYIWSGTTEITERTLVAWSTMCLPKAAGGLHIFDLKSWNKAAVAKVCYDLAHKEDKLRIWWIHAYYVKDDSKPVGW
ncbi:uncharacterized protein LOC132034635 [Lycium ferocissimum]|uniref:uncharacterized protein LOC132034635 n=1 Tax=Lycium ferocissimum TaxID=112874 RepID=UPI002815CF92|nr:uncharacterized protein LOC132034635 [Lycium ferocissimum]